MLTSPECCQHPCVRWHTQLVGSTSVGVLHFTAQKCACPETKTFTSSSSRGTAAHCLKVGTGLKRAVSFRPWPIYPLYRPRGNGCRSTASNNTTHFTLSIWTGSLWIWNFQQMFVYVLQRTIYMAAIVYWGGGSLLCVIGVSNVRMYWSALKLTSLNCLTL
jgi:hypothetical protein